MAKQKRIDYSQRGRITPEIVSNESYMQKNKDYALNFGSAFRIMKDSILANKSEKQTRTPAKIPKTKNYKKNKYLLNIIKKKLKDPSYSSSQFATLKTIEQKLIEQLNGNVYNQQKGDYRHEVRRIHFSTLP